jgi:hypothetical protein
MVATLRRYLPTSKARRPCVDTGEVCAVHRVVRHGSESRRYRIRRHDQPRRRVIPVRSGARSDTPFRLYRHQRRHSLSAADTVVATRMEWSI